MVVLTLLLTMSLKRVEEDKMSASNREWPDEQMMVAAVGGKVRRLVEALRMTERRRVGRTLPNLEQTPNEQAQAGRQEVDTPHGQAQACEMLRPGLGGLQAWGGRGRGFSLLSHTHSNFPEPIVKRRSLNTIPNPPR